MSELARYLVPADSRDAADQQPPKRTTRCPVCERTGTLRETEGMILCTHCFWAVEVQTTN